MSRREGLSLREIARRTGLSRNTLRRWLRESEVVEPVYPARTSKSVVDPWAEQLGTWLNTDRHRPKRERRTAKMLYQAIKAQGYAGGYGRVSAFVRRWKSTQTDAPRRSAYVPMVFAPGEAFQFDWSCEYAVIGGVRRRLEVAHVKLAASRAFWLGAYLSQSHEMLFDAHTRAFQAFGGIPKRGIYDNMKTAVDRIGRGKERTVNARFEAMCSHYLFEPQFCNRAAGWEKGIVEKNVQDRRRQIWAEIMMRPWDSLDQLNEWLSEHCRHAWEAMRHPTSPERSVLDVWRDEQPQLMPLPRPFDGYLEQPVRVSATALIHYQRNRYSVPVEHVHRVVSLRSYPSQLVIVAEGIEIARLTRRFERHQTFYDFRHYISLIARKPGALRNGAPFAEMPLPLMALQKQLLRHTGGERVMVQVLSAIPVHGLEPVLVAARAALDAGCASAEHVLNVLSRLLSPPVASGTIEAAPVLREEPTANVARYDQLLHVSEVHHDH